MVYIYKWPRTWPADFLSFMLIVEAHSQSFRWCSLSIRNTHSNMNQLFPICTWIANLSHRAIDELYKSQDRVKLSIKKRFTLCLFAHPLFRRTERRTGNTRRNSHVPSGVHPLIRGPLSQCQHPAGTRWGRHQTATRTANQLLYVSIPCRWNPDSTRIRSVFRGRLRAPTLDSPSRSLCSHNVAENTRSNTLLPSDQAAFNSIYGPRNSRQCTNAIMYVPPEARPNCCLAGGGGGEEWLGSWGEIGVSCSNGRFR